MLKPPVHTVWGTDPEAFFRRDGEKIIGSERFIPAKGLTAGFNNSVVRDGVQFEMHPVAAGDLRLLGLNLSAIFILLNQTLKYNPEIDISFDTLVEVTKDELDSLSPSTRVLGCQPSLNIYGAKPIDVDPLNYRKRSSGGHIHMGLTLPLYNSITANPDFRERLVPLLDIFAGNSFVLLDRDPGAAERRINYGRAGEYRLPKHGLEYRTPSNFWLRDYRLMSFAFGMAAVAIATMNETVAGRNLEQELVDIVNIDNFRKAIDTNNFELALENFNTIKPFLSKYLPSTGFPLNPGNLDTFISFAKTVNQRGIESYFPTDDIVRNWSEGAPKFEEFQAFLARI